MHYLCKTPRSATSRPRDAANWVMVGPLGDSKHGEAGDPELVPEWPRPGANR